MKSTLKSMLISLLTGISFTAGVIVVMILYELYEERQIRDDRRWVESPVGIEITEHRRLPDTEKFTVVGKLRNDSGYAWDELDIDMDVLAGESLMNRCTDEVHEVNLGEVRRFEVSCYDASGRNVPDNIRYEVRIATGRQYNIDYTGEN